MGMTSMSMRFIILRGKLFGSGVAFISPADVTGSVALCSEGFADGGGRMFGKIY